VDACGNGVMTKPSQTDVVIVGSGFSGLTAAITAVGHGASVIVVEKMERAGGNSRVSGGNCSIPHSDPESVAGFTSYLQKLCFGTTPPELVADFVQGTLEIKDWIKSLGGELHVPKKLILANTYPGTRKGPGFPAVPGGKATFAKYCLKGPDDVAPSERLFRLLESAALERGCEFRLGTRLIDLLFGDDGEVRGVVVETAEGTQEILARSVIMACGGFENNRSEKLEHLEPIPVRFVGNPGNTGDGHRILRSHGVDLWHMGRTSCIPGFQSDDFEAAFGIFMPDWGYIYCDRHGRRFLNEMGLELHETYRHLSEFDPHAAEFPRVPAWVILDQATLNRGPLTWDTAGYNRDQYTWSQDNQAELAKGWIVRADSVEELGTVIDADPEVLRATLAEYNEGALTDSDKFGRPQKLMRPLEFPLYAVRVESSLLNTQGGPRRDSVGAVSRIEGGTVPGLYAVGEFGSIWGYLYQGACNISECIVSGRKTGRVAAERATECQAP